LTRSLDRKVGAFLSRPPPHARSPLVLNAGRCAIAVTKERGDQLVELRGKQHAEAREQKLDAQARLAFHQKHSSPPMKALQKWMQAELDEHRAEPNSPLGEAYRYMLKHWGGLTLFLRVAGAPLDNNLCERALKKAILQDLMDFLWVTGGAARA